MKRGARFGGHYWLRLGDMANLAMFAMRNNVAFKLWPPKARLYLFESLFLRGMKAHGLTVVIQRYYHLSHGVSVSTTIHPICALPSCWNGKTIDYLHVVGIQVLVIKKTAADEEILASVRRYVGLLLRTIERLGVFESSIDLLVSLLVVVVPDLASLNDVVPLFHLALESGNLLQFESSFSEVNTPKCVKRGGFILAGVQPSGELRYFHLVA